MTTIFKKPADLKALNLKENLGGAAYNLGIEILEIGPDHLTARMPVHEKTWQPMGILHGGATCLLAETVGSIASNLTLEENSGVGVGQSLFATHMRPVKSGFITATARPQHLGRKSQVWEVDVLNDQGQRVCLVILTTAIVNHLT